MSRAARGVFEEGSVISAAVTAAGLCRRATARSSLKVATTRAGWVWASMV